MRFTIVPCALWEVSLDSPLPALSTSPNNTFDVTIPALIKISVQFFNARCSVFVHMVVRVFIGLEIFDASATPVTLAVDPREVSNLHEFQESYATASRTTKKVENSHLSENYSH